MNVCAQISTVLVAGSFVISPAAAQPKYSDWSTPVNLGCTINSAAADQGPALSKDGLSLYFASARVAPGAQGAADIYVAQRASTSAPWGAPVNLNVLEPGQPAINTAVGENTPAFSRDGHYMFFITNRGPRCTDPGATPPYCGYGDTDIWASYREHVHDDSAWTTPFNVGPGINSSAFEGGPSYFENEEGGAPQLYFNRGVSQIDQSTTQIMVADLQADGTFGNAREVPELNSPRTDSRPSIRHDGLELFLFSSRDGNLDIYVATRKSIDAPWNTPVRLGPQINTSFREVNPHISADGLTLLFASDRTGTCGDLDIYMSTRTKLKGKDE
jgi:Tol biopolymer transport system component